MTRSQSVVRGKRKRSPSPPLEPKHTLEHTPLTCLYVQDLDKDQIWAQLELRAQHVCKVLECALDGPGEPSEHSSSSTTDDMEQASSDEDGSDMLSEESDDDDSELDEEVGGSSGEDMEECVAELRDESVDEDEDEDEWTENRRLLPSSTKTKGSYSGLNDGFFDLAEFNAETEEAEAGFVSNGALDADSDGASSGEDEIDYFASIGGQLPVDGDRGKSLALSVIGLSLDPTRIALP